MLRTVWKWAALIALGAAAAAPQVASAKGVTWDWNVADKVGPDRRPADDASESSARKVGAINMALSVEWILDIIEDGETKPDRYTKVHKTSKALGKALAKIVKANAKPSFADALPEVGRQFVVAGIELSLGGKESGSEKQLTKALKKLDDGRYVVFAYEKGGYHGLWLTFGLDKEKKRKTLFDPMKGQCHTTKSATAAKYFLKQIEETPVAGNALDTFVILRATRLGGFDMKVAKPIFEKAGEGTKKDFETSTKVLLRGDPDNNWVGKDWTRFVMGDSVQVSVNGAVQKTKRDGMSPYDTLQIIVGALGSPWQAPPDTGTNYDPDSSGPGLKDGIAQLRRDDLLYRTMIMTTQAQMTRGVLIPFRDRIVEGGVQPPMRFSSSTSAPDRFKPDDKWWIEIDVSANEVTVTQHVTLIEGRGEDQAYKVRIHLKRVMTRRNGKVKVHAPDVEATVDDFRD